MPSVTSWTRIEPRCRDADMQRTVNARVFDPLWMLTRQWQVGEYRGEDAGTPVNARLRAENAPLSRIVLGHLPANTQTVAAAFDPLAAPIEVLVERERVRPAAGDEPAGAAKLALAVDAGLHLLRLLDAQPLSKSYRKAFVARFALRQPAGDAIDRLDAETRERMQAFAGRAPDARRIEASFRSQGGGAEPFIDPALGIAAADLDAVRLVAKRWLAWYAELFAEPGTNPSAWLPERLEYAVSAAARLSADPFDEFTLTAPEVHEGRLDWCDFDLNREVNLGSAPDRRFTTLTQTVLPAPVSFRGAPAVRFWEMEDSRVDYALTPVGPTDLAHLLLIEYASSYGNDWYLVPLDLPVGSLTRVRSLVVTDTFGIRTLHRPIGDPALRPPHWSLFQLAHTAGTSLGPQSNLLFLAPALATRLESPAREEVLFMRDEMANMAWAIERVVESPIEQPSARDDPRADGRPVPGAPPLQPPPPRADGVPYYDLSSDVPEHWVPLLPVQLTDEDGTVRTRLKRGAVLVADGSRQVRTAVGEILGGGGGLLRDEEVPREGVRVTRQYEMARWIGGTSFAWVGRKKTVGRGEGSSGLAFDRELGSGEPAP